MQELMPKVVLQRLAAPQSTAEPRSQLIAALKGVLWRESTPVGNFSVLKLGRQRYLEAVCTHLTATEQASAVLIEHLQLQQS